MNSIGNISLILAALVCFSLNTVLTSPKWTPSTEAQGYFTFGMLLMHIFLFVLLALGAWAIHLKDGFAWISNIKVIRFAVVIIGLLALVYGMMSMLIEAKGVANSSMVYKWYPLFFYWLLPALVIVAGFMMLNEPLHSMVPPMVWKVPLTGVFLLGLVGLGGDIVKGITESRAESLERKEVEVPDQKRYHWRKPESIATCDVNTNLYQILVFTDPSYDANVREKALAKIKSNPGWQQEIISQLMGDGMLEAFVFLAANDVDDPSLFQEPIRKGILNIVEWIQRAIYKANKASDLTEDRFLPEIQHVISTVDRFQDHGLDFVSDMEGLRSILDSPPSHLETKKAPFKAEALLDQWLEKHQ